MTVDLAFLQARKYYCKNIQVKNFGLIVLLAR